jgi:hypothetical protein
MKRGFGEAMMSLGAVALLLLALVAIDDRVREQLSLRFASRAPIDIASTESHVRDLTTVIARAARDKSLAHAPLLIFTLSASILVLFMLRT